MATALRPSQALALLRRHCGVLRGRLAFDATREPDAHAPQLWLGLVCTDVTTSDLDAGLGYKLRVALDVVNALCACRGYEPHLHPEFWRDAVCRLWIIYTADPRQTWLSNSGPYLVEPPQDSLKAFDAAAFSHFAVDSRVTSRTVTELALAKLWRQISWTDAAHSCPRKLMKARDIALARLLSLAVRPVRTLTLELLVPSNTMNDTVSSRPPATPPLQNWQELADAIESIGPGVVNASAQMLSLAVRQSYARPFTLDPSNLPGVHRLLTCSAYIQCLHLDVAFTDTAVNAHDRGVWFGELLRTLILERKSLRTLRLLHNWVPSRAIALACSLLPVASCLREFGCTIDVDNDPHSWRWLMYALQHPLRHRRDLEPIGPHALVISGCSAVDRSALFKAARATSTPLRDIAIDAIEETAAAPTPRKVIEETCQWFDSGAMAARVLTPTAEVFASPDFQQLLPRTVVRDDEIEVVVVAACRGAVGVVVRGFGLCWLRERSVSLFARLHPIERHVVKGRYTSSTGVNTLHVDKLGWGLVMPMLRGLECTRLTSLTLTNMITGHDMLVSLLLHCPNLESLQLRWCALSSVEPLIDAYAFTAQPCRIASLLLRGAMRNHLSEPPLDTALLWEMLEDLTHPGSRTLRHLSLAMADGGEQLITGLARVLAVNRTLETVYIDPGQKFLDARQRTALAAHFLSPFQDQVLGNASAVCVGLLSVVCHGQQNEHETASGCLDSALVRAILEFVGPTTKRTVSWLCDDGSTGDDLMWP